MHYFSMEPHHNKTLESRKKNRRKAWNIHVAISMELNTNIELIEPHHNKTIEHA